jgi:hypothetical protein
MANREMQHGHSPGKGACRRTGESKSPEGL